MTDNSLYQLTHIITHYGRSIIDDPRRCEALLRDLCPEQRREVNMLVSALKEDVPHDLISMNPAMPAELTLSRLRKRLYDDLGMAEDFAHWAVETWGLALGMVKQRTAMPAAAKPVSANRQPVHAALPIPDLHRQLRLIPDLRRRLLPILDLHRHLRLILDLHRRFRLIPDLYRQLRLPHWIPSQLLHVLQVFFHLH